MRPPAGHEPLHQHDGTPGRIRVSKTQRRRLAHALHLATGMDFAAARRVIAQRAGDTVDELEAWLRSNYRFDPTGVTAVRNASRGTS